MAYGSYKMMAPRATVESLRLLRDTAGLPSARSLRSLAQDKLLVHPFVTNFGTAKIGSAYWMRFEQSSQPQVLYKNFTS